MIRKFWESLSFHLCPSSELLYPTVYAASPLGHQICIPNITHPNINSWSPPSMLFISSYPSISATFFQLLQPKTLKDLESVIQKYSLFYIFLLTLNQNKARSNILTTSTYCYHYDPWHHQHHLFLCIIEMYSEYSFILSPNISSSSLKCYLLF